MRFATTMLVNMLHVLVLSAALCACTLQTVRGAESFLDTHLSVMKKLLHARALEATGEHTHESILEKLEHKLEDLVVDAHAVKFLFDLHDDDGHCGDLCLGYITDKLFKGHAFMNWDKFAKIITDIYGDEISDDPFQPQELHLALTNSTSSMNVMFVTMQELTAPFVEITATASPDAPATKLPATTSTYRVPQKWWPIFTGTIYSVDMVNLSEDSEYSYRVGGQAPDGTMKYSATFSFKTAPTPSPDRQTVVSTMADHGTFELLGWKTVNVLREQQDALGVDLVHVAGDLSYAGLSTDMKVLHVGKEDEFEHVWDLLFIQNQKIAATVPWMVTNGNHERFYDWAAYRARFTMPTNEDFTVSPPLQSNGSFWCVHVCTWVCPSLLHLCLPVSLSLTR